MEYRDLNKLHCQASVAMVLAVSSRNIQVLAREKCCDMVTVQIKYAVDPKDGSETNTAMEQ